MLKENVVNVWSDEDQEWDKYKFKEMDEYFNFYNKPNWEKVREVFLHDGMMTQADKWLEIVFKNNSSKIYNNVFGTYVEQ
ncbi:ABC transporter substrate-binding protein [Clostridium botulinum]|uniref:hypothetical protein n=1 Tax=Clostridium botulinum TaxID=1491 RepID=UPI0004D0303A|nr:hypothetical protein [Clostridium botulinum]MBY6773658.1 ABC transporter substrate-binding protein [Clostridium botulinum]MBY6864234.1 ABC transporter substrate-binding protein [Clostridium botulinum]MBY6984822.1 ABC transporter substrate-binding protein [Clostridium botulinum]NFP26135.1 ABC transporter substrate-binding protein [Clostridium botulinum]